jgi:GT2 family glycosyltransferase
MRFAVVTPCFNPGHYLVETLQSVIAQAGDFSLHYHVQDAISSDGSIKLLQSQLEQLKSGNTPLQCRELTFSYSSEPDLGMYDGINKGFREILQRTNVDVMLWINADDKLEFNALSQLNSYFSHHPDVEWIIGRTLHLNEDSKIIFDAPPHYYRREDLARGRHNSVTLPFVTQEATVWRTCLWEHCGQLDASLRYAGDFEYWMRAARLGYDLRSIDIPIGYHRKRLGQLSSVGCYADEVKMLLLRG